MEENVVYFSVVQIELLLDVKRTDCHTSAAALVRNDIAFCCELHELGY